MRFYEKALKACFQKRMNKNAGSREAAISLWVRTLQEYLDHRK
jgi:hypothetical protein